jgi:Ni,Fe-hydrogenase I small subunit
MIERMLAGEQGLTLLWVEGSIVRVPHGTGMFDTFAGKPKRDIIRGLCDTAYYVLAMGTCAAFDGLPGPGLAHRRSLESASARSGTASDRWLPLLNSSSPPN